jgi:hypothetical protein
MKACLYCATIAAALFFAYWEDRLKRQLTDKAFRPSERISDFGVLNDLEERMQRERILKVLPKPALGKYRKAVVLKFFFVALLILEVIVLQRTR